MWRDRVVRVRFAPSPTGFMHLGGLRTALYNYIVARQGAPGSAFLLRIEDTDRKRFVPGAVDHIVESLRWAGIMFDEGPGRPGTVGPYIQSERLELYRERAHELVDRGHAYYDFSPPSSSDSEKEEDVKDHESTRRKSLLHRRWMSLSREEARARIAGGESFVVRQCVRGSDVVSFDDIIRGVVRVPLHVIDDTVLLKSDGFPTYHLASVVDDHLMDITHVIRGEEWIASTPKHVLLYDAFEWKRPEFAHLPLLLHHEDRSKLSKRHGHASVDYYRREGFLPEAVLNACALLGWHPSAGAQQLESESVSDLTREVLTVEDLIARFRLDQVQVAGAVVDLDKMRFLQAQHVRRYVSTAAGMEDAMLRLTSTFQKTPERWNPNLVSDPVFLSNVVDLLKERLPFIERIPDMCFYFFVPENSLRYAHEEEPLASAAEMRKRMKVSEEDLCKFSTLCLSAVSSLSSWTSSEIASMINTVAQQSGVKYGTFTFSLRYILTLTSVGSEMAPTMQILGKERCTARLHRFLTSHP